MKIIILFNCLVLVTLAGSAQQKQNLDYLLKEVDPEVLQQKIKTLGAGDESSKWTLMTYYDTKKDLRRADSVLQATIAAYPLGQLAYIQLANKIVSEGDVVKKEQIAARILKNFPNADKNRIHHSLAYGYANAKNVPKVVENINAISTQKAKFSATLIVVKLIVNYTQQRCQ
ncbi:MAG: hypothetical protein EOO85_20525, partial [Pedobacter sp.]